MKEFLFSFLLGFLCVCIIGFIGQRLIVNKKWFDKKTIIVIILQSLVIAALFTWVF